MATMLHIKYAIWNWLVGKDSMAYIDTDEHQSSFFVCSVTNRLHKAVLLWFNPNEQRL